MAFIQDYELERRYHPENFDLDYDDLEEDEDEELAEEKRQTLEVKDIVEAVMKV